MSVLFIDSNSLLGLVIYEKVVVNSNHNNSTKQSAAPIQIERLELSHRSTGS